MGHSQPPPADDVWHCQNVWDTISSTAIMDSFLERTPDSKSCARLLACMAFKSGVWLDVFPNKSLGLRMDG